MPTRTSPSSQPSVRSPVPAGRRGAGSSWAPLLAVSSGFFMVVLDVTVVTVAVPSLGADLHAGPSALQWVVDGYTLVFACLMPLCGGLGDRFGHRRAFLTGLAVFTAASAACGAAPTAAVLIMARLAQGAGAAAMVPASLALLRAAYPEPAARARAFGVWAAVSSLGAAAGPLVGGLAVAWVGWRAVFLVNLPIGLLAVVLTVRHVPAPPPHPGARLNVPAQIAALAALAALVGGLNEAGTRGWTDPVVLACLILPALFAALGVLLLRRTARPVMTGRRRGPAGGAVVGLLLNVGFYGLLYLATLYFQRLRDYRPLEAGLALLPMFVVMAASSFLAGRLAARTGPRLPMIAGLVAGAAGLAGWLPAGPHTPYPVLIAPMAVSGAGTSFAVPAVTAAVMESVPKERGGTAAALLNAARQLGSALGVALFGSLAASRLVPGLHASAVLAAAGYLLGAAVVVAAFPRGDASGTGPDPAQDDGKSGDRADALPSGSPSRR